MSLLCGGGGAPEAEPTPEEKKADEELKKAQAQEAAKDQKIIKMLLLGAGESGKSTIFKQMKVINKNGYTEKERKEFIGVVHMNVCQSMKAMVAACEKLSIVIPGDLQPLVDDFGTGP